jgi:hypothetical protein
VPSLLALVALAGLLAACSTAAPPRETIPVRADFRASEMRQPVVFAQLHFGPGDYTGEERKSMEQELEGALLDELNTRALLAKEVRVSVATGDAQRDPGPALARARELGADHAVLADLRVSRGPQLFCQGTRKRFQATATRWEQTAEVLRASDGAVRLRVIPGSILPVLDLDADCDNPRDSRRLSSSEAMADAVRRILTRLLSQ